MLQSARRTLIFSRSTSSRQKLSTVDKLCDQMQRLAVTRDTPKLLINYRKFHTTTPVFQQKFHLDHKGAIKEQYLIQRRAFLARYKLLQDKIIFQNRNVYENRHLYDIDETDQYGLSNLQRMLKGLAPIISSDKNYLVIHHFDQTHTGDWVVLLNSFHVENDLILHSQVKVRNAVNRQRFAEERMAYWQQVANTHLEKKATFGIRKK
jgi:hypothetical protein